MIVRMSKLEIAGPKDLLLDVLDAIRDEGVFQPEPDAAGFVDQTAAGSISGLILDERTAAERLFLEHLQQLTSALITLLPPLATRDSRIDPRPVLDTIAAGATRHLLLCRRWSEERSARLREQSDLEHHAALLSTIEGLIGESDQESGLEFIGITLRDPAFIPRLRGALDRFNGGASSLTTAPAADGTLIGLIAAPAGEGSRIKRILSDEQLPELPFPAEIRELPLPERIRRMQEQCRSAAAEVAAIDARLARFARQWLPFYRRIDQWLRERLALLAATSVVRETGMCFVILGWARSDAVTHLARRLRERFGGRVALEELQLLEHDAERVPVSLRNPPYFRPFELLTRLLPLPRYSSWDPTPFIGIFFPLFFGMMLGDAGHGLVLLAVSLLVRWRSPAGKLNDAARILMISASYAILFGILFGEFFGAAGARFIHLEPFVPERSRAILPMLVFSLGLGVSHVTVGLVLGLMTALRRHHGREAAGHLVIIGLIACLTALAVSLFIPFHWLFSRSILVLTGLLVPFLVICGGFLAPLELIKDIGNIISYVRIMAIGLGCALLANAANNLAGLCGDLLLGTLAALALHAVAIVLGAFAPAIHALRLHFVEFFSKFVEQGGKGFEPLHK